MQKKRNGSFRRNWRRWKGRARCTDALTIPISKKHLNGKIIVFTMRAEVVRLDENGRLYLPASLRKKLKAKEFYIEERGEEIVLVPVRKKIEKYWGIVKGERLNAEEIDRVIEEETEKLMRDEL
jgi:bifunctional DNA-binding transcriptional regulator/antitoxin component of YhaV-PrlF toxin-antitoxin module